MAFSVNYYNNVPTNPIRSFLCDARSDIANLPTNNTTASPFEHGTPIGSTAFVIADSSVWVLSNAGQWVEI